MRVFVLLVEGFGAQRWLKSTSASHSSGIVDQLPYGYYRAADDDCTIEYSQDRKEWRVVRLMRLVARRLLGFDLLHAWRNRKGIFNADVVWTHTELENLATLLLFQLIPRACRPKIIAQSVWLYDRWGHFSRPKRWLYRKLLAQADLLSVLSPENQQVARRLFPDKRVEFVKFGIDHAPLSPPTLRKCGPVIRVLALGRDMHRDWDTLIKAVHGWERCEVRIGARMIDRKAVAEAGNISLVAPHSTREVSDTYRWADMFVLPLKPNFHASGITVLEEAALFGVPVIATDTGGLGVYFSGNEVRYVPPGDVAAMRAAIEELGANDRLRYDLAKRAQDRIVRDNLSSEAYALRHRALSEELLAQRREHREGSGKELVTVSSVPEPVRVFVFLGHDFGARWARGGLPGINEQLPYGYYHAEDYGCVVKYSLDAKEGRLIRFIRLGMRRVLGLDLLHAWHNRHSLFDTDVVWTHTELEHLAVLVLWRWIPRRRRPKLIAQCVWLFDKWNHLPRPKRWLYAKLLSQVDVLTLQSSETMRAAQRALPGVPRRLNLYGTRVDAMVPAVPRAVHTPLRILSLGRDVHRDWATVIEVVKGWESSEARIGARYIDRKQARQVKNIELVNPDSTQLRTLYDWADVVVVSLMPNLHISGITVITEAVLMGAPIVCTDTGGLRSYFSDDEIMYVPPNDAVAMRRAIVQLAADDALRFNMTRKAQERILRDDLSTRARAERMAELSRELLEERLDIEAGAPEV